MTDISSLRTLQHFVDLHEDLGDLSYADAHDYRLNRIAAILRQLLFDKRHIIPKVQGILENSSISVTPVFSCVPYKPVNKPGLLLGASYDYLEPIEDFPIPQDVKTLHVQELKLVIVGEYRNQPISVKDLVKYIANKEGAVHFDQENLDVHQQFLNELQLQFRRGQNSGLSSMLPPLGRIVYSGLQELAEESKKVIGIRRV